MFQFLRRVSGSFLFRPDLLDAPPTIGRKRRHSLTEQDGDPSPASPAKKTKNDPDATSRQESPKEDAISQVEVKEVTKGVKKVDLEDRDEPEDAPSIPPEGVPLPDSPSASPEPASESQEPVPEPEPEPEPESAEPGEDHDQERADDEDSVASSTHEADAEGEPDLEFVASNTDATADEIAPAPVVAVEPAREISEVKAI